MKTNREWTRMNANPVKSGFSSQSEFVFIRVHSRLKKFRPMITNFPALAAVASLALLALSARAQDNQLEVNVRPKVVDKAAMRAGKTQPGTGGHSKIYGILSVQEIKGEQKLIKPVDENAILQLLSQEMNKNGFQLYAPGTKPDIVITASYGRGEVQNPYIKGSGETGGSSDVNAATTSANLGGSGSNDSGATSVSITGAFADQLMDEKSPGFEAKLQKAAGEKLFIRVTAWAYPTDPKAKSRMLWKTVIVVDDPDHRDLNAIAQKMLEAGAPYFDKEIREREADVYKPLPDGHVNVGAPEVVPPKTK
jgi:hypothetical protein